MEVWERVFLGKAEFLSTTHGQIACVLCHEGDRWASEKEAAHQGMITDPSEGGQSCLACHADVVHTSETSLHTTLTGMREGLMARGGSFTNSPLAQAFDNHCQTCHATCGSCHVSRSDSQGGGLVSAHYFKKPSILYNCAACHGARAGNEYLGNHEGIPGDVHWTKEGMSCNKCHGEEIHQSPADATNRYHNRLTITCVSSGCHDDLSRREPPNEYHREEMLGKVACQACHSVEYKNCYGCHVALDGEGKGYFTTEPSVIQFKIGLNPIRSKTRPSEYVVLRHVPVNRDMFEYYGTNLLPDFDAVPTWKYATPHNIQLHTPQTESCNSCHGQPSLFLTGADVAAEEMAANRPVIVTQIPAAREGQPAPK